MNYQSNDHNADLQTALALCRAWFHEKNINACSALLDENVSFIGITMKSHTRGKQETLCLISGDIYYLKPTNTIEIISHNILPISDDTVHIEINMLFGNENGIANTFCVCMTIRRGLVLVLQIFPIVESLREFEEQNANQAETELTLHALYEHIPSGICKYRWDGNQLIPFYINARFNELIGIGADESLHSSQGLNYRNVHPDDLDALRAAILDTVTNTHKLNHTYRTKKANSDTYIWLNMQGNAVAYAPDHVILYACYTDVTEHQKLLIEREKQFAQAQHYHNAIQIQDLIIAGLCNITTNRVLNIRANLWELPEGLQVSTREELINGFAEVILDPKERTGFLALFNAERHIEYIEHGKHKIERDYQIVLPGETVARYVRLRADLTPDIESGDILAIFSIRDVTNETVTKLAMDYAIGDNFDYVCLIDLMHNTSRMLYCDESVTAMRHNSVQFSQDFELMIREVVADYDLERVLEMMSTPAILRALQNQDIYTIALDIKENGKIHSKQARFRYLDKAAKTVLLMRSDITDVLAQEQNQRSAMETALLAAQQASVAKSDFLSRMSHEIRTPLNAIIGMTEIALRTLDDKEETAGCISRIGSSSRNLLALINNILDMSRIESGTVLLKTDKFNFTDLLSNVTAVISAQAKLGDIQFETKFDSALHEYYIGDTLRLQQILTNILSNAVKFTPRGGTVTFSVAVRENDRIRFVIKDTGIGINKSFLAHIFEPFAQENNSHSAHYEGTGLGLPIAKNIVDLMGGLIDAESTKGEGTTFTIDIPLVVCSDDVNPAQKNYQIKNAENIRVLVADDDISACESMIQIIRSVGMQAEWTSSGFDAVRRTTEHEQGYDLLLIDWSLSDIGGTDLTRKLRGAAGKHTAIIITTEFDANLVETEARRAGADLLLAKPVYHNALISAFEQALNRTDDDDSAAEPDFTDLRILLTEDNPTNAAIAKRLLNWRGFTVDVAENGQIAVERFSASPPGTYAAILMDIRMPVMDGLTAAKIIRSTDHPDAQKIPILAMTANAFEEDKEKSRKAGMNYHLAKPIDPTKLYDTLASFLFPKNQS